MIDKELQEKIEKKLKEARSIRNLNSKNFRFKTWHATTINLLKDLPPDFIQDINDFKKLTFTDTKYHRGNRFFNPADNTRYREDLDLASTILKKITSAKKVARPEKAPVVKEEVIKTEKEGKTKKPSSAKKARPAKKISLVTKTKPAGKAKTGKSISKPKKPSAGKIKKI